MKKLILTMILAPQKKMTLQEFFKDKCKYPFDTRQVFMY